MKKVALVTGASRGIGKSIALKLAKDGFRVIAHYNQDEGGIKEVLSTIEGFGGEVTSIQADLSKAENSLLLVEKSYDFYGQLDLLVNNAGALRLGAISEVTLEDFDYSFTTNVKSLLFACQKAVQLFGDKGGNIINISSINGTSPSSQAIIYSATKACVESITKSLAIDLGKRKIRVNAVAPGPVRTDMQKGILTLEVEKAYIEKTPLGRVGEGDDIAKVVSFLASEDSYWITGETLTASGGIQ